MVLLVKQPICKQEDLTLDSWYLKAWSETSVVLGGWKHLDHHNLLATQSSQLISTVFMEKSCLKRQGELNCGRYPCQPLAYTQRQTNVCMYTYTLTKENLYKWIGEWRLEKYVQYMMICTVPNEVSLLN